MTKIPPILLGTIILLCCILSAGCMNEVSGIRQDTQNYPIGEIYGNISVSQSFIAPKDSLTRIDVLLATYDRNNTEAITFQLREEGSAENIVAIKVNAEQIKDNEFYRFDFDLIPDSKGRSYIFTISSPDSTPGNAITIWFNYEGDGTPDAYRDGTCFINNDPFQGDLSFRTYHESSSLLDVFFSVMSRCTQDLSFFIIYIMLLISIISGIIWLHGCERGK